MGQSKIQSINQVTKKKTDMPTEYDVEVFQGEDFVQGFSGPNALCNAVSFMNDQEAPYIEYVAYDVNSDLHWVGPRPGRP